MNEGYYDGTILRAWVESDQNEPTNLYACFSVQVEAPGTSEVAEVQPKHPTFGQHGLLGRQVVEHLGLKWPEGLRDMSPCLGRRVRVKIKHKVKDGTTYENAYIVTPVTREPATKDQIEAGIARLEAKSGDGDLPF